MSTSSSDFGSDSGSSFGFIGFIQGRPTLLSSLGVRLGLRTPTFFFTGEPKFTMKEIEITLMEFYSLNKMHFQNMYI